MAAQHNMSNRREFMKSWMNEQSHQQKLNNKRSDKFVKFKAQKKLSDASMNAAKLTPPSALYGSLPAPSVAVVALNRLAYGPRPGDVDAFNALGANDTDRLNNWLDQQLTPDFNNDPDLLPLLSNPPYRMLQKTRAQFWADHIVPDNIPWEERIRPYWETTFSTFARAVYSQWQLHEVMTEFWHDHFNVYGTDDYIYGMLMHYDRDVIRPQVFGNFRSMLQNVAESTCMLFYLDNAYNEADGPNENYAREVLELHTLGAINYLGTIPWDQVPVDGQGRRIAYVEDDVKEFARALTGWSVDGAFWDERPGTGEFLFRTDSHDQNTKKVLGVDFDYSAVQPQKDCEDILDMLCEHPGTAQFVVGKLCTRLVSDSPPQSLIDSAAAVFQQNWQASNQIELVIRHIVGSSEFLSTWGEKIKRPFNTAVSAYRALQTDFPFNPDAVDTQNLYWFYNQTGHERFGWVPPNGSPDTKPTWEGSNPMVMTWRFIQSLPVWTENGNDNHFFNDVVAQTLAGLPDVNTHTPNNLAAFWWQRIFGYPGEASVLQKLATFMSYTDRNQVPPVAGDLNLAVDITQEDDGPAYTAYRLRAMVGLMLMSPEFLRR
ncbi:MAG: DUF1800 domain-containing protein [bacterium]